MEFVEYECPNCGGQVNNMNSKMAFCPYCGTKLERQKEHIKDYIGRALEEIRAEQYEASQRTVDQALRHHPDDSDLNLIKAVLSSDNAYLDHVSESEVSSEVMEVCVDRVAELKKLHINGEEEIIETNDGKVGDNLSDYGIGVGLFFTFLSLFLFRCPETGVAGGFLLILGIMVLVISFCHK